LKAFGPFQLDTMSHCLWCGNERMPLTPKAFDVLRYLVEHADRLVTQDELLEALWRDTYVNPEGIRKYILEIRKVLGDQLDRPLFVETLPKRGCRFVAKVVAERLQPAPEAAAGPAGTMVGRDGALAQLNDCLKNALRGQRQIVFVTVKRASATRVPSWSTSCPATASTPPTCRPAVARRHRSEPRWLRFTHCRCRSSAPRDCPCAPRSRCAPTRRD